MSSKKNIYRVVLSGMFLAIAMVLPLLTGQIPQIGKALSPMHIPVVLCGFFCGPWYGLVVGFIAPLLRGLIFGMPVLFPSGVIMAFELATYGCVSGLLYRLFPKKIVYIYITLICSMLIGRVVWGVVSAIVYGITKAGFGWQAFLAGAFINAVPGIILHVVLIPAIVIALRKSTAKE